jgi:cyclin T
MGVFPSETKSLPQQTRPSFGAQDPNSLSVVVTAAAAMSSQSFVAGPVTHHQLHHHGLPYHQDPPPLANPRRRRRDHDDMYHPYAVPYSHPYAGAAPYHVPRDLFALSHHQERLFPSPPDAPSVAGPPAPKRGRRAPDPRWDPPPPVPAARERLRDEGDPGTLLSLDEIERRSPSRRDGIDSALEARLRASYCAYLRCLSIRLGM